MNAAILLWFQSLRTPWLNAVVLTFTNSVWLMAVLMACLLIPQKTRKLAISLLAGLVLSLTVSTLLKAVISEPRPFLVIDGLTRVGPVPGGSSFPSSHTTAAFALFWMLLFRKNRFWWLGLVYAILVALSRMYLGVHYPTDILGGIVVSLIVCFAVSRGIRHEPSDIH